MDIYSSHPKPYVYICTHKITGEFYIGYREYNVILNKPGYLDLPKYKTSSAKVNKLFEQFDWQIISEFETGDDAYDYEQKLIHDNWKNPLLLNKNCYYGKLRFRSQGSRSEDTKRKISESHKGKVLSNETRQKISEFRKDRFVGDLNPMYGKTHSDDVKLASSLRRIKTNSERNWYNNGIESKFLKECPVGWTKGRLNQKPTTLGNKWYNNGIVAVCTKERPVGNEWVNGMLPKKKS